MTSFMLRMWKDYFVIHLKNDLIYYGIPLDLNPLFLFFFKIWDFKFTVSKITLAKPNSMI